MEAARRNHSIDCMKGICIVFIIITHFTWNDLERLRYLFPFWIDMAVPFFMIISGFVYARSFIKHEIVTLESAYCLKNVLNRFIRYTVPFAFVFAVEEMLFIYIGGGYDTFQLIRDFLSGGMGPGSYYYPVMIQFVLYFPIIYILVKKHDFRGVCACALINIIYEVCRNAYGMNVECYRLLVFRYTLCIAFGCYLSIGNYKRNVRLSGIMVLMGILYIVVFRYLGYTPPITNFWTGTCIWACLYIIPISAWILNCNGMKNGILELFGKASYNIFLVQMIYYRGARIVYGLIENRALQLGINIVICLGMGVIFYYVEKPVTDYINKKAYLLLEKIEDNSRIKMDRINS